jgi:ABC-type multidrug transport system ATPase subunit
MIEMRNVSKSYGPLAVLDEVTLSIARGQLVALVGPNGAGKSTLLQCLLGITGYAGTIRVAGFDPLHEGKRARNAIGYMPQNAGLHDDLTVAQTMQFYAECYAAPRMRPLALLQDVGLADVCGRRVAELSGGMQQRLSFAVARLHEPSILLLDEPSASLDRESKELMLASLRRLADGGTTILLSTHLSHELTRVADRFILLEDGRVADLDPADASSLALPLYAGAR